MVEQVLCKHKVVGSSPIGGSMKITIEFDENWQAPYNLVQPQGYYDPCEHCMNNPKSNPNASGVCSCALPDLYRVRYY